MQHPPPAHDSSPGRWLRENFPFGLLHPRKPRHFREVLKVIADNAAQLPDAWRVLNGPCNGCAVQTDGLRDEVMPDSPHFCLTRLGLIEETLRQPFDPSAFSNVPALRHLRNEDIEHMGRIPVPLLWRRGRPGYEPLDFAEGCALAGEWIRRFHGDGCGFFTTSKGINNEEYFAFQQFARVVGRTNNVDSCARQCHAASVSALKAKLGVGAMSGSLRDFIEADVLVLAGTNLANNQPLIMRYIDHGKRTRGGRPFVIVINPYREPGLERYWVPSSPASALFGTKICDLFIRIRVGGDVAFYNGVAKCILEDGLLGERHHRFIAERTCGFDDFAASIRQQPFEMLCAQSGTSREEMREVARVLACCENATFAWGMGLTQHATGTGNVKALVNLALLLGQFGRPGAGVAPLRGQSSVQSAGECGVAPNIFPGGDPVDTAAAAALGAAWGAPVPDQPGMATGPMLEAVHRGEIGLLFLLGGNLLDTMPGRPFVRETLSRLPFRIRLDVMMNSECLVEPGEATLILPVRNWYEWDSVYTTTSTDRTIRAFGPSIRPRCPGVDESWRVLRRIAEAVLGADARGFAYGSTDEIRREMNRAIWMYRGIASLTEPHDRMQWGGETLHRDGFERMPDGRARFSIVQPRVCESPPGVFLASTRRGWGQWNSQHRRHAEHDHITGAEDHRDVLINPADASRLGLGAGRAVRLLAEHGAALDGYCRPDDAVGPGHVQLFWPVANDLIPHGVYDGPSGEPDYNVRVRIEAV